MVLPGESTVPEFDEVRLMKSGRIKVALEGDKEVLLRRPKLGELRYLMERYDQIIDEIFESTEPGAPVREGKNALDVGPRWWTEVLATLAPEGMTLEYDHMVTPSWTVHSQRFFNRFWRHWTEIPLVSDAEEPDVPLPAPTSVPEATTLVPQTPTLLRQVVLGASTGP